MKNVFFSKVSNMDFDGKTINGYRCLKKLGQGGFGSVWKVANKNNEMFVYFEKFLI